ncbi:MAG: transcription-repair coupling factor [Ignavibacteriaceae bacterium]
MNIENSIAGSHSLTALQNIIKKGRITNISPLFGSVKSIFAKSLLKSENQIIVLFPDVQSAAEFLVELDVLDVPENSILLTELKPDTIQEKLTEISKKEKFILVATYELLNCQLPLKEHVEQETTKIQAGGKLTYNDLIEYLNLLNYQKDKFVEAPGYYSQRGAIIDFWSYSERNPARLEYDGDFLESIRYFDPDSQRSIETTETVTLAGALSSNGNTPQELTDIFNYLNNPIIIASSYALNNLTDKKINLFTDFSDEKEITPIVNNEIFDVDFPENFIERAKDSQVIEPDSFDYTTKENTRWIIEEELASSGNRIELGFSEAPTINSNYGILFSTLKEYAEQGFNITITAENELQSSRLKDLLIDPGESLPSGPADIPLDKSALAHLIESDKVKIETFAIKKGFINRNEKILLLTDYQIFNKPYRTKVSTNKKYKKSKAKTFASIKRGDFVVHEDFGIGKYAGLETIKIGDINQESMKIIFDAGSIVYVNLNYLTLVKKYSSNENLTPTLSTLGTADWANIKQRTKKKIKEAARDLIELYAKRKATKGYQFNPDTVWQKELEASFFYEDTPDQEKVTEEVKKDMEAENPMDRLVCGDVGFGKTEIAVRAAFKAAQEGKQTAILVPTTILAEQHFNTFSDRLMQFPVKVAALSRFQTKKQQIEILNELSLGKIDVVIGTHRILSKDVKFKDLGLLIIDEEHRFGVMAKEKLRSLKLNVDTLTLTATPIPRTLNLSLLGARDLSIISTPPPNRQSIYTQVSVFDIFKIKEWILNELKRNGQVYIVHDRIQSIDKLAGYIQRNLPDVKIAIAHGQMKPSQLESVIHGFLNRKYDVLISTKIIESGIDIPNVNTIIVNRADRFGLAELHQLRGRVGRSNRQAHAFFIVPSLNGISKKALRRLQAIEEFTDIGAGFNISMRDLEIRGAGNLLGTEQSGFINEVGFDLYVKLINEAVEELKYEEFKEVFKDLPKPEERTEPTIDTYFEIGIPPAYMPEQMDRLNFYTALYSIKNISELEELKEEMNDRFGPLPVLVERLIAAATLKLYASHAMFEKIIIQKKHTLVILPKGQKEDYYNGKFLELMKFIINEYHNSIIFDQQKDKMRLVIQNKFDSPENLMKFLINFSQRVMLLFGTEIKNIADSDNDRN